MFRSRTGHMARKADGLASLAFALLAATGCAPAGKFDKVNRLIRDAVLAYGDKNYDEPSHLVRRVDYLHAGRVNIAQHSAEYAAALFDAGQKTERANAIINAILDHQWNQDAERPWQKGNFIWWADEDIVRDPNAVVFLTPWLCYIALECDQSLQPQTRQRLREALPRCIEPLRKHPGRVYENDNHWLLRAAALVMLSRALDRPELLADGEKRIDDWINHVAAHGISEFNSPCYAAVSIFAFEWIYHYAPASTKSLRDKTVEALNFLYADVLQQWHWQAGIQAGTHSRAYPYDVERGESLVAMLVFKQCGGPLRMPIRAFEYVFAVNDYRVPDHIRAYAQKKGRLPMWLRASHPVYATKQRVDRSVFIMPEVSVATQTGRRPHGEQDVGFKITYAGSKVERRATYITANPAHVPGRYAVQYAAHQEGPAAIVLYEVDLKGLNQTGLMRLNIEPADGGMIEEFLVDGRPYRRDRLQLPAGAVLAWRVGDAMVALRLLQTRGLDPTQPEKISSVNYVLSAVVSAGLCLDCSLTGPTGRAVPADDLSCGFAVQVVSARACGSLADLATAADHWMVKETRDGQARDITWRTAERTLRLEWDGAQNAVIARETNGQACPPHPRYDSPLIRLKPGEQPQVIEPASMRPVSWGGVRAHGPGSAGRGIRGACGPEARRTRRG